MPRYYFTYGTSGQPFYGGWTEVIAPDIRTACSLFRTYHPDKTEGLLNCASYYTEEEFSSTEMIGPGGNFGNRCHEVISLTRFLTKEGAGS